ncbi:rhodanese-like domain-containing protein [Chitinophagaceae bacterium MMS25-I14]
MLVEQIYTGCLAQGAYYIESNGEAAVIDPLRETEPYTSKAGHNNAVIKYIFETHFHADFVSGHIDLMRQTNATIVYGPGAHPGFPALVATDGQQFKVGNITFTVLHTPGHTMESSCFLMSNEKGKPVALFSGDTLFIGDVGRPDLAQKAANMTKEELAGMLYDSLRSKIMPLPDDIVVYPGHGAGSACGKNMSRETSDILGNQKKYNYALRSDMTRGEFISEVTAGLMPPPAYFPQNASINRLGYKSLASVLHKGKTPLSPEAFEAAANATGALILDTRDPQIFTEGFIPNAINIGLDGNFAPWAGTLIPDMNQPLLLVTDPGREEEAITRLARVGLDNTIGYADGGFKAWKNAGKEVDYIPNMSVDELAHIIHHDDVQLLDIRKNSEFQSEHVEGAINMPLDYINDGMPFIKPGETYFVYCGSGYRSVIFISILRARGYDKLINVAGGFKAVKETGRFAITDYVQPATLL